MLQAFGSRINDCHFYMNENQVFREDYSFEGQKSASIQKLEKRDGVLK